MLINIRLMSVVSKHKLMQEYEGKHKVALIKTKKVGTNNTIIRQLYYPFRQWQMHTSKEVIPIFFEKQEDYYSLWQFKFADMMDYNSIELVKHERFQIYDKP